MNYSRVKNNYVDSLKEDQKEFLKNKLILKTQQRFKSERHVFTEVINKIALNSNYDQRMQPIDSIETYAYQMRKYLVRKKENVKCNNVIKQDNIVLINYIAKEGIKEHNSNWPEINNWRLSIWRNKHIT